ncbi:FAS1 domain-containing protein [Entophlyctis helioformis]|nr:FAS1 domain-containing protein [Entophlyctis helioformis]
MLLNALVPTLLAALSVAALPLESSSLDKRVDLPPPTRRARETIFDGTIFDYLSSPDFTRSANEGLRAFTVGIQTNERLATTLQTSDSVTTLFLPNNAAFDNFVLDEPTLAQKYNGPNALANLVAYHAIPNLIVESRPSSNKLITFLRTFGGKRLRADTSRDGITNLGLGFGRGSYIVETIVASNGLLHIVDAVLLEPFSLVDTLPRAGLTSLSNYIDRAGLTSAAESLKKPVTIFAPSNIAFSRLSAVLTAANLRASVGLLSTVLDFHIVTESFTSADIYSLAKDPILAGTGVPSEAVKIAVNSDRSIEVSGDSNVLPAVVTISDIILSSSGILHVIDAVLLPSADVLTRASRIEETVLPVL